MRRVACLLLCSLVAASCGCSSNKPPIRSVDLLGKWRLVRVGGQPPAAYGLNSLEIDLAADGTWTSEMVTQGQVGGITAKGGGNWSLADEVVSYTSGENAGKSRVRLDAGRLTLDPDFTVRKDGTTEVTGEYER